MAGILEVVSQFSIAIYLQGIDEVVWQQGINEYVNMLRFKVSKYTVWLKKLSMYSKQHSHPSWTAMSKQPADEQGQNTNKVGTELVIYYFTLFLTPLYCENMKTHRSITIAVP